MKTPFIKLLITFFVLSFLLIGCGVKLNEESAHAVMEKVYKARKSGSFYKEFKVYAVNDFEIVPFEEVESTLRTVIGNAGRFKKAHHLNTKISRRNQLGKGLVNYMVMNYRVEYANMNLLEAYYFQGESEIPKLVYVTLLLAD